ncbi:hypothetical protein F4801DRAFT_390370 [Xylaria longipes]|nr:hypothetical protein F4801DRAFT_390370 [Xylaria longipes]
MFCSQLAIITFPLSFGAVPSSLARIKPHYIMLRTTQSHGFLRHDEGGTREGRGTRDEGEKLKDNHNTEMGNVLRISLPFTLAA